MTSEIYHIPDALEGRNGGRDHSILELSFTKIVLLVSIWKCTAANAVRTQKPEIMFIAIVIVHISAAASFKRLWCFLSCMSFCKLKYMCFFPNTFALHIFFPTVFLPTYWAACQKMYKETTWIKLYKNTWSCMTYCTCLDVNRGLRFATVHINTQLSTEAWCLNTLRRMDFFWMQMFGKENLYC